jgi:hypothetical protein
MAGATPPQQLNPNAPAQDPDNMGMKNSSMLFSGLSYGFAVVILLLVVALVVMIVLYATSPCHTPAAPCAPTIC